LWGGGDAIRIEWSDGCNHKYVPIIAGRARPRQWQYGRLRLSDWIEVRDMAEVRSMHAQWRAYRKRVDRLLEEIPW
jgi:hypothetical protein